MLCKCNFHRPSQHHVHRRNISLNNLTVIFSYPVITNGKETCIKSAHRLNPRSNTIYNYLETDLIISNVDYTYIRKYVCRKISINANYLWCMRANIRICCWQFLGLFYLVWTSQICFSRLTCFVELITLRYDNYILGNTLW